MDILLVKSISRRLKQLNSNESQKHIIPVLLLSFGLFTSFIGANQLVFADSYTAPSEEATTAHLNKEYMSDVFFLDETPQIDFFHPHHTYTIVTAEGETQILTTHQNISDILEAAGIEHDADDRILPSLSTYVTNGARIKVERINQDFEFEIQEIPYESVQMQNSSIYIGEQKVVTEGVPGESRVTYKVTYKDGVLISRTEVFREVVREPVNQVIAVGTTPKIVSSYDCDYWYAEADKLTGDTRERNWLKYVMHKESGCNAGNNRNPIYKGLFQFLPSTYYANGGTDIWNGHEQMRIALHMARSGSCSAWLTTSCQVWNSGR